MKNRLIKWALAGIAAGGFAGAVHAQEPADALRFSFLQPQGTARSIGFGNALGSLGGDFSSLSVNPAGIGIYRKSEFTVTPSLTFDHVEAKPVNAGGFSGAASSDDGAHFSISNFGLVFAHAKRGQEYNRSGWKSGGFAIGMNRLADFTRDYTYTGTNTSTSASWIFESDANRYYSSDDFPLGSLADVGYQSYLLDTATLANGERGFLSVVNPGAGSPVRQRTSVRERGGASEFLMSFGGNYEDKLMLGATLGFPYLRYVRDKTIDETDLSGDNNNNFDYFTYNERLRTSGLGFNAKLGLIYKPIDAFRIGAAFHTPTWYGLHDDQTIDVAANTEGFAAYRTASGGSEFDYSLRTPWRAVLSASAFFGKAGFVTVDYEYVDYASARFRMDDDNRAYEQSINDGIRNSYRGASNLRGGVEFRLDILSLRAGIGYYGDPYKTTMANYVNGERWDFSGGIGFRFNHTFLDLGFIHHQYKNTDEPYVLPYTNYTSPTAALTTGQNSAVLTLGWKF